MSVIEENSVDYSSSAAMEKALRSLAETLQAGAEFVLKFTDTSIMGRFLHNSDHQEKFEELNGRLSECAHDLNLALNLTSIFDQRQDVIDRHADLAEISSKLDEIALDMANQQQDLLKENENIKDEFKRRFDSFKFTLRQDVLKAENPMEAKKIEAEAELFLHIPYHDLLSRERIGQGGFADVYEGTWLSRHQQVAIKRIRIAHLTDDGVKQSILKEIATMYKIRYDHVLGVYGACIEPSNYALVLEFMSLGSLFDVLQKKEHIRTWEDRWSIALQMVKGVNYLHTVSILHCDIKSLNFLMEHAPKGYRVKISDFGLAKLRLETHRLSVESAEPLVSTGTLQWKAPELLKFGKPSKASDIYSLGVVFWELATGCVPYEDVDEAVLCQGVRHGDRLDIPTGVPLAFTSLISSAWRQEPNQRPTAQALIEAITSEGTLPSDVPSKANTYRSSKLEALINESQSLSKVQLNKQLLVDADMAIIVQRAIIDKQCRNLSLESNGITSRGASTLAHALLGNTTLHELWLYGNQLSDAGVHHLATALSTNTTVRKLGLASNHITNTGVSHLADMFKRNSTLIMLGLAMNRIGNQGIQLLANALVHSKAALEVLTLDRNELVSDASIDCLASIARHKQSMKELWVNDCSFSEAGKRKLQAMTTTNESFKLVTEYKARS